jgi:triacylglycerol esterase/lipase EstA (alpha/beta hydrolase family)
VKSRAAGVALVIGGLLVPRPDAAIRAQVRAPEAPTPVLLVPGWSEDGRSLEALRARLIASGWRESSVAVVDFRDPVGSNREHAREIALAAAELRETSGFGSIDVVAHSMGGLAVRYYLRNRIETADVRRVVFLATPHFGTYSSLVAWGAGAREMLPGSDFLLTLMEGRPVPHGVDALTIRTPLDLHILPPESAVIPGVPDMMVCCPTHTGLLDDPEVFRRIEGFLRG